MGFYNAVTDPYAVTREGPLDVAFVINSLDAWAAIRTRPTVLVLDNVRFYHAVSFKTRLAAWEDQNVCLFCLLTYCPHLNKI